jgi:hypothetical protein
MQIMDNLPQEERHDLLYSHKELADIRLFVHTPWLHEIKSSSFQPSETRKNLISCQDIAKRWADADLEIECCCLVAAIWDEYEGNAEEALSTLNAISGVYPNNFRIARQKQKIFSHSGDHKTSLSTILGVIDNIPARDRVERTFAFREAGCSAARISALQEALKYFSEARKASIGCHKEMLPMSLGLLGDLATINFMLGDAASCLKNLLDYAKGLKSIDPKDGIREKWCHVIFLHTVMWMRSQIYPTDWTKENMSIFVGSCSNPEPHPDIVSNRLPSELLQWYELAGLEQDIGLDVGILDELRKRTSDGVILSLESTLNISAINRCVATLNAPHFIRELRRYTASTSWLLQNRNSLSTDDALSLTPQLTRLIEPEHLDTEPSRSVCIDAVEAFILSCLCQRKQNIITELVRQLPALSSFSSGIPTCLINFPNEDPLTNDLSSAVSRTLKRLAKIDDPFYPEEALIIACNLWQWLRVSNFKRTLSKMCSDFIKDMWLEIVKERGFTLRLPAKAIPAITTCLNGFSGSIDDLAAIVLTSETYQQRNLSEELRDQILSTIHAKPTSAVESVP